MSIHFLVRLEPFSGKETAFREELLRVVEPSRAEPGCLGIHVDEAAFELHANLPHTVYFLRAVERLLPHPMLGLRARQIGGGAGAGAELTRPAPSGGL